MASKEHKIVRRAEAMSQLGFLSKLLAERFNLEAVDVNVTNRDPELAEIQRIENLNALLREILEAGESNKPETQSDKDVVVEPEPAKTKLKKHGPKQ